MIATIARKEFREMLRDGRFRWAGAIVLALLAAALLAGWEEHRSVQAEHAAAQALTRQHWLEQGDKNPHSAAHYGVYAFRPRGPLSFVDPGLDPYVGVATWLEAHYQNPFQGRPAQDGTVAARFGTLAAAGVLQVLVPLLIVLLGFAAFSGEREQGTLRQVLSIGVRPATLAWAKALGLGSALGLLLVPAAGAGALALVLAGGAAGAGDLWARSALLALVYLLYFAAIIGITLTVSAFARSSRVALVVLIGFWIVNVLVAPRAAADLARQVHPTPSHAELMQAIRFELDHGIDGHSPADDRVAALRERTLAEYGVERVEDLPINFAGLSLQAGEEHGNLVFDRHFGGLHETFARQESLHRTAGFLTPMLAVRSLSMALAGTGGAQHRHFAEAAETHRRLIQRMMNGDLAQNSRTGETYLAGADLWAQVPAFHYDTPDVAWAMHDQSRAVLALLLWSALAIGGVAVAAARVKVVQ